ncbi:hypothetical protein KUCAC02_000111 [Chaenocephalus aceratus]|nr:hypothetical protein KUCAC02_000111 [Chaenocephalus aceratus]
MAAFHYHHHHHHYPHSDLRRLFHRLTIASSLSILCFSLVYLLTGCCESELSENTDIKTPTREFLVSGWQYERNGTSVEREVTTALGEDAFSGHPGLEANSSGKEWTATRRLPQALIIGVKKGGTRALLEFCGSTRTSVLLGRSRTSLIGITHGDWTGTVTLSPRRINGQWPCLAQGYSLGKKPGNWEMDDKKGGPSKKYDAQGPGRSDCDGENASLLRHRGNAGTSPCHVEDVKLIVVVRDPVTRAISDYTQIISKTPDIPPFESLAFKNRTNGEIDSLWSPLWIGLYAQHLERWLAWFPRTQIHLVSGERLISDPAGELGKVQDFSGSRRAAVNLTAWGRLKGGCTPPSTGRCCRDLGEFYKPHNQRFYQMAGQDFGWQ